MLKSWRNKVRIELEQFGLGRLGVVVLVLATMIAGCRGNRSTVPPVHLNQNMDFQQKFEAQETNEWFNDGRGMRQPVKGTVNRASLTDDGTAEYRVHYQGKWETVGTVPTKQLDNKPATIHYFTGLNSNGNKIVAKHERAQAGKKASEQTPPTVPPKDGLVGLPSALKLNSALLDRGEKRYNVFCTPCHGTSGYGDGSVAKKAAALTVPSYHGPTAAKDIDIRTYPLGYIYHVISKGSILMQPYAAQIPVADRWAIAAWVRTLQRSQTAGTQEASN
jgi:mono/diheme cytochrome c family protein